MIILKPYQREKLDNTNDFEFYSKPRFVYHLDLNFRKCLTELYSQEITQDSVLLDLMSSWDSYLPSDKKYKKVIGHGLNKEELTKNKSLDSFWVQNLNTDQRLPLEEGSIDYCLIVAGWQYLQYPELISMELSRVMNSKGKILISFSNRAFWTKSPNIWTNSTEEARINYVMNIVSSNGFHNPRVIRKFTSASKSLFSFLNKDPFYCVIATKS